MIGWLYLFPGVADADGTKQVSIDGTAPPAACKSLVCLPALRPDEHDALGRLAYAEAGNQGDEGLAAVVYTVLNRLADGHFGSSITTVIESPGQFEPVDRVGGHWRNLTPLLPSQSATIETILMLIREGRLPDPTHGATFFQNPRIVARREAAGEVRAGLTNFNNQVPIAVIRDHAFFAEFQGASPPHENEYPMGRLVIAPGATLPWRVDRVEAPTRGHPHGVMYRIVQISGTSSESTRAASSAPP